MPPLPLAWPPISSPGVDLRGHGLSDKPEDYSWSAFRNDVAALLDKLDLRDVVIVAHSRGGGVRA
jgi:non-heme chloroperoxidase